MSASVIQNRRRQGGYFDLCNSSRMWNDRRQLQNNGRLKIQILQSGLLSERRVQWRLPCQLQRFTFVRMHFYWLMAVDYYPSVKVKFLRPLGERGDLTHPKPVSNDRGRHFFFFSVLNSGSMLNSPFCAGCRMVGILIDLIMHLFWDLVAVHDFES